MGAASAALSRCVMNMHTGLGNWRTRNFFRYFRKNLRNATPIWLIYLLVAALLIFDLMVLKGTGTASGRIQRIAAVLGLILWEFTAAWVFPLTSHFENTAIQTIKNAFYLAISYLPRTIIMGLLWILPVGIQAYAPDIMRHIIILWPVLFFGATAYLCSKLLIKPFTPYFEEGGVVLDDEFEEEPVDEM